MVRISELNKDWYTPGDVADMLGVVPMTVIGYDNKGIMKFERTPTNRRIISKNNLIESLRNLKILVDDSYNNRYDALYARVSTQAQSKRGDLDTQINTLLTYCATQNPINLQVYKDVGSGLNDKRKGLTKLIQDIENNQINRLFITYKDRLTRFGFNYLFEICKAHNTNIIQISNEVITKTTQEELAEDLCAIIHSFSGKLYGLRKSQIKDINDKLSSLKEVDENDTG
jgi:predicted site-specific integrase-resolvase